ncbi:hypothetical protein [Helicobacter sp. 11S03491-1]|uniref:hypothetical protein n=1 Tax=Helicobacter sp. 11S03491-1 TaxID=1476196 RepID=UPI000BA5DB94|nr:hypothetical protein [Helicobacter sp. 11S03491-1]PAF41095.1 hypothetical protein BKH45_08190 [Helicobacter sp. 11S03491-1]
MNKTNIYQVVFSSIFFLFFIFSMLALLVSQFSEIFSQLFLILTRDERAYQNITIFFYFCIIIISIGYLILSIWNNEGTFLHRIIAMGIFIFFVFVFIFNLGFTEPSNTAALRMVVADENLHLLSFWSLLVNNFKYILISGFFYLFFLIFPLILYGFNYHLNTGNIFGRYLAFFCPSINICIIVLLASAFQPYYDKSNSFLYIDFLIFCISLMLFLRVFLMRKDLFNFYEYANMLLLIMGILICLLCSNILSQVGSYYNARMAFYLLAFLGYIGEWMSQIIIKR